MNVLTRQAVLRDDAHRLRQIRPPDESSARQPALKFRYELDFLPHELLLETFETLAVRVLIHARQLVKSYCRAFLIRRANCWVAVPR